METNTRIIINYNTWKRRENYEFFKDFLNPSWSVTCDVDCTEAYKRAKSEKSSFFLKYLYAILRAANEVEEMRYRVEKVENNEVIVLYKNVSVITPIAVGKEGRFHSVNIPYNKNFEKFSKTATEIIKSIPEEINPYAAENAAKRNHGFMDMILVASNPGLAFTSMTCTQSCRQGSEKPLINVGKMKEREGRLYIPVFTSVHHGLCDGHHITQFYDKISEYLAIV